MLTASGADAQLEADAPGLTTIANPGNAVLTPPGCDSVRSDGVHVLDEYLAARIELLEQRSPRFAAAMARARQGPISVVIGTPAQVRSSGPAGREAASPEVAGCIPHAWPAVALGLGTERVADFLIYMPDSGSARITRIVIRAHVDRIRTAASVRAPLGIGRGRARRWMDTMTDAMLIHELWGHLIPIVEAGDFTGNCPDPVPGQPDVQSCVMQRENALRQELGLSSRTQYALRVL